MFDGVDSMLSAYKVDQLEPDAVAQAPIERSCATSGAYELPTYLGRYLHICRYLPGRSSAARAIFDSQPCY